MSETARIRITDPEAVVMRSVSPTFFKNGMVVDEAFRVNPQRDGSKLSVSQESKISPDDFIREVSRIRKAPAGLARLSVEEVEGIPISQSTQPELGQEVGLTVWDDSMLNDVPDHHAHIEHDLVMGDDHLRKAVRKILAARANRNGRFYKN